MNEEMTYEALSAHYDRIYHDKPYAAEASRVVSLLRKRGAEQGDRLLDIGCGTAKHVRHLINTFDVTGVDLHDPVLDIARERVPEARFLQGDITAFDLGETFEAVTCLFGVIGYVETWENLDQAIARVAEHLEPGGPFVIESWLTPGTFEEVPALRTYDDPDDCTLARIAVPHMEDETTARLEIEWIIARPGQEGIQRFSETQHMGVFDVDRTLSLFDKHGLDATFEEEGLTELRGLYVGTRRA